MRDPQDGDSGTGFHREEADESFLSRWSRRKHADHGGGQNPPAVERQSVSGESPAADDARQTTAPPPLTDADMPPVESLDEASDYAPFLSPGVSEQLRKQALRKLFHLPGLHVPDGLDDYDEDFTQFATLGNIVTQEMERMLEREKRAADANKAAQHTRVKSVETTQVAQETPQYRADDGKKGVSGKRDNETNQPIGRVAVSPEPDSEEPQKRNDSSG